MNDSSSNHEKGTIGENFVNMLAFDTYLKYWCYPNPIDLEGDKKEICDLLICFKNTCIIISVKNHEFKGNYERYKKKVIDKSTNQLYGAERKLFHSGRDIHINHPDRGKVIFKKEYYNKLYRITINIGEQFEEYELGDWKEGKGFISILNKETFETIIQELDTLKDLIDYFDEREKLLNIEKLILLEGQEKDLLAVYLKNIRSFPEEYYTNSSDYIVLSLNGSWENFSKNKSFYLKKLSDETSYFVDHLVVDYILNLSGGEVFATELMSLSRLERRALANILISVVNNCKGGMVEYRSYHVHEGIGYLLMYYPPHWIGPKLNEFINMAMRLYSHRFGENKLICLAATTNFKEYKFFYSEFLEPANEELAIKIETLIKNLGWFTNMKKRKLIEKEYPDEPDEL